MERAVTIRIMREGASCRGKVAWVQWSDLMRRWSVVVFTDKTMEDNSAVDLEVCRVDLEAADQMTDLSLRIKAQSRKFTWAILTRM